MNRHLFLFGGSPPFTKELGKHFSELAMVGQGKIAILFLEREGWQAYMPKYTSVLEQYGLHHFDYIPISQTVSNSVIERLNSCTGLVIGGGDTEKYQSGLVDKEIGNKVIERYNKGIPVAGFSAGALISPKHCVIPAIDNSKNEQLFLKGLGLINDCVVSVHFTKWQEDENLKTALLKTKASKGYGIDDEAGLYLMNETIECTEGGIKIITSR